MVGRTLPASVSPVTVSVEPVAHKALILDHHFAHFAETKPAQGCDPCPTRGEQRGNGANAEFLEGVHQNSSVESKTRSPVRSAQDESYVYIVTFRLKTTPANELVVKDERPGPKTALLPHSFLGGNEVLALRHSEFSPSQWQVPPNCRVVHQLDDCVRLDLSEPLERYSLIVGNRHG